MQQGDDFSVIGWAFNKAYEGVSRAGSAIGSRIGNALSKPADPDAGLHALVAVVVIAGLIGGGYGCWEGCEAYDKWSYKRTMEKDKERKMAYQEGLRERFLAGQVDGCLVRSDNIYGDADVLLKDGTKKRLFPNEIAFCNEEFLVARAVGKEELISKYCPGLDIRGVQVLVAKNIGTEDGGAHGGCKLIKSISLDTPKCNNGSYEQYEANRCYRSALGLYGENSDYIVVGSYVRETVIFKPGRAPPELLDLMKDQDVSLRVLEDTEIPGSGSRRSLKLDAKKPGPEDTIKLEDIIPARKIPEKKNPHRGPCTINGYPSPQYGDEGTMYCEFLRRVVNKPIQEVRREYYKNCRKRPHSEAGRNACSTVRYHLKHG